MCLRAMENACFNAGAWASSQTLGVESRSLHLTSSPADSGTQSTAHEELLVRVRVFRQGGRLVKNHRYPSLVMSCSILSNEVSQPWLHIRITLGI